MLGLIVGHVDFPTALVLIVIAFGIGGCSLALLLRPTKQEKEQKFELDKLRIEKEAIATMYARETERDFKMKSLEQNLITSHKET
jgi:hypothetical protein